MPFILFRLWHTIIHAPLTMYNWNSNKIKIMIKKSFHKSKFLYITKPIKLWCSKCSLHILYLNWIKTSEVFSAKCSSLRVRWWQCHCQSTSKWNVKQGFRSLGLHTASTGCRRTCLHVGYFWHCNLKIEFPRPRAWGGSAQIIINGRWRLTRCWLLG